MNGPRNIVTPTENDGGYIDAQFVREEGEVAHARGPKNLT